MTKKLTKEQESEKDRLIEEYINTNWQKITLPKKEMEEAITNYLIEKGFNPNSEIDRNLVEIVLRKMALRKWILDKYTTAKNTLLNLNTIYDPLKWNMHGIKRDKDGKIIINKTSITDMEIQLKGSLIK